MTTPTIGNQFFKFLRIPFFGVTQMNILKYISQIQTIKRHSALNLVVKVLTHRSFHRGKFPSNNFPNVQFPKRQFSKCTFKVRLGLLRCHRLQGGAIAAASMDPIAAARTGQGAEHCGYNRLGKLSLVKLHIWEIVTLENSLEKLTQGKMALGKYLTSKRYCLYSKHKNIECKQYTPRYFKDSLSPGDLCSNGFCRESLP